MKKACTDCKLNNIELDAVFKDWLQAKHDNLSNPHTYCNPIEWLDESEEGMKRWNDEK